LGSKIEKIVLIPGEPFLHSVNPGIVIKYSTGDICIDNPNLRYSTYIFLTCDKSGIYYPPKFIGKINNNCTFFFEWETRNGCPSCLKKNLNPVQVKLNMIIYNFRTLASTTQKKSDMKRI
jgi:hypothetical protein